MKQWILVSALTAVLCGCSTTPSRLADFGPRYRPANFHAPDRLPPSIRRVVVLPLATAKSDGVLDAGAEHFAGVLDAEVRKSGAFEVVTVTPAQLQQWTGRRAWRADEALPVEFFKRLRAETGCDAVLFPALNAYRAYPPLAIGWDLRLIDCAEQRVVWAVDELLDAGAPAVARAARDYGAEQLRGGADEEGAVLQSPRRFAQFSAAALVGTLPPR